MDNNRIQLVGEKMNEISCDIVNDVLPLYADGKCSEYTKKCIIHHTGSCDTCRKTLSEMNVTIEACSDVTNLSDAKQIDKNIMKAYMEKFTGIACIVMLVICVISGIVIGMFSDPFGWLVFGLLCYNSIMLCVTMYYSFISKYKVFYILAPLIIIHIIISLFFGIMQSQIVAFCFAPLILGLIAGKIAKR